MTWPFYLVAVLVPTLIVPFFADPLEIHKMTVFVVLIMISAFAWLFQAMRHRQVTVVRTWTFLPVCLFFIATCVSALLSVAPGMSWLGLEKTDGASVVMTFAGMLCVLLIPHIYALFGKVFVQRFSFATLLGGVLVVVLMLLSWFGILPLTLSVSLGAPNALAFYLGTLVVMWLGSRFYEQEGDRKMISVVGWILYVAFLGVAFTLDAPVVWLVLVLSLVCMLAAVFVRPPEGVGVEKILPPVLLIVLAIFAWLLPPLVRGVFPAEIVPSFSASWSMVQSVWHGIPLWLGTGPGTYAISYAQSYPLAMNATPFWNVTFQSSYAHLLTLAVTHGLFGLITFLFSSFVGLGLFFQAWLRASAKNKSILLVIGSGFIFLFFASFVYSFTLSFVALFFLLLGFVHALRAHQTKDYVFASSARASLLATGGFVVAMVAMVTVMFVTVVRYTAEISYAHAVSLRRAEASIDEVIVALDKAASRNQWNDRYYRELSLVLLEKVEQLVQQQASSESVQSVLAAAVNASVRATDIGPQNVQNWKVRGNVYREVAPAVANAADFSIGSFQTAQRLAPNNPAYAVGLARAYLMKADLLRQQTTSDDAAVAKQAQTLRDEALASAEKALQQALTLKKDYTVAQYFLSMVYERQGKLGDAVKSMEAVKVANMQDVGVGMQLSLLYLRQGKNDLAKAELQRIVALSPTFSNAHWYLSVIYEEEGKTDEAIKEVEAVLQQNPENQTVKQRLERLQSGVTSDDAATTVPPIEDDFKDVETGR